MSSGVVSWNGRLSKPYQIYAGVRQGGSLSPVIFSVYVDSVIDVLLKSNLGCYIGHIFLGIIMYADDLLLISGSVSKLQKMVDVCLNELCQLEMYPSPCDGDKERVPMHYDFAEIHINLIQ